MWEVPLLFPPTPLKEKELASLKKNEVAFTSLLLMAYQFGVVPVFPFSF